MLTKNQITALKTCDRVLFQYSDKNGDQTSFMVAIKTIKKNDVWGDKEREVIIPVC